MNVYKLSRAFWDYSFENPEKIKPNHCAMFFFAIEHCNRLGWKEKFGFPTAMVMDAIGIKSYNTYKKTLEELVEFGFINMIEQSKNQYSSNIIALSANNKALDKALDKALIKHSTKQSESTVESIDSIDKQINKSTKEQLNIPEISEFLEYAKSVYVEFKGYKLPKTHIDLCSKMMNDLIWLETFMMNNHFSKKDQVKEHLFKFCIHLNLESKTYELNKFKDFKSHFNNWHRIPKSEHKKQNQPKITGDAWLM